jgi:hypothetical protein
METSTSVKTSTIKVTEFDVKPIKKSRKPAKEKEHIIYSTEFDEDDCRQDYKEFCEENGIQFTEDGLLDYANENNRDWLNNEKMNLNKPMTTKFLVIASLGLWDGRRSGYRVMNIKNLNDIFNVYASNSETTFSFNRYDVHVTCSHHDGTNYYTIREIKEGREKAVENLCKKLYENEKVTQQEISYCTKSIRKYMKEIYGW